MDDREATGRVSAVVAEIEKEYEAVLAGLPKGKYRDYLSTHKSEYYTWNINLNDGRPIGDFFAEQGVWKQGDEIPDYLLE